LLGWQRSLLLHIAQGTENKEGLLFAFSGHCLSIDMPGGATGSISAVESSYNFYVRLFGQSPSSIPPPPSMFLSMTLGILQFIDHQDYDQVRTSLSLFHVWPRSCLELRSSTPDSLSEIPPEATNRRLRRIVST